MAVNPTIAHLMTVIASAGFKCQGGPLINLKEWDQLWDAIHSMPGDSTIADPLRSSVATLQRRAHEASRNAGWWHQIGHATDLTQIIRHPCTDLQRLLAGTIVAQKLCLIHSEISEAMEGHRKDLMDKHLPHREMIEVELADALIRIGDLAGAMGLDLGGAVVEKMAYNAQRADHKPEARAATGGKAY